MQNIRSLIPDTNVTQRNRPFSRHRKSSEILRKLERTEYFVKLRLMPWTGNGQGLRKLVAAILPRRYKRAICQIPVEGGWTTVMLRVRVSVLKTSEE